MSRPRTYLSLYHQGDGTEPSRKRPHLQVYPRPRREKLCDFDELMSQKSAPHLPYFDNFEEIVIQPFQVQEDSRSQSLSPTDQRMNMVSGRDESSYQQDSQSRNGYYTHSGVIAKRRNLVNPPVERNYRERMDDGWREPYRESPTDPLHDETFSRTIQLIASGDDDENQQSSSPSYHGKAQYPPAPRGLGRQQRFFGPTYDEFQRRDVASSPVRSPNSAFSNYGYNQEVSPTSVMAFPTTNEIGNTLRQRAVDYGELIYVVDALDEFTFVLPNLSRRMRDRYCHGHAPSEEDVKVARRRLISAVCFYGGNRPKVSEELLSRMHPFALRNRKHYEFLLSRRYRLHDDHISWDIEANPPVGRQAKKRRQHDDTGDVAIEHSNSMSSIELSGKPSLDEPSSMGGENDGDASNTNEEDTKTSKESKSYLSGQGRKKGPYHCRLCGQPKQKHDCPFRKDLQRNIGAMVYPVINAFTTDEIGELAPRLLEMNSFIGGRYCAPTEPEQIPTEGKKSAKDTMVPERAKSSNLTIDGSPPKIETMKIQEEQYKSVTPVLKVSPVAYRYGHVPVFKKQRIQLSDTLFSISERIPNLTKECAEILDEAQEMNMWDQAAAELFAQVLTIIHCEVGDHKLEGLSMHLRDLGIAC